MQHNQCLLVSRALNGQPPSYIAELLHPVNELSTSHSCAIS